MRFLSTPSGWRATTLFKTSSDKVMISIHALRVEGDGDHTVFQRGPVNFYPRPPGGGRLALPLITLYGHGISIHALRVEGDV